MWIVSTGRGTVEPADVVPKYERQRSSSPVALIRMSRCDVGEWITEPNHGSIPSKRTSRPSSLSCTSSTIIVVTECMKLIKSVPARAS